MPDKRIVSAPSGSRNIVLAGNPNVGKSVFFNYLTRQYVDVSNFPGTTLDIICGRCGQDIVTDTPGIYGISSFTEEEKIARDIILKADLIINVVDAVHLERDLFLTQQLIDTGIPLIVALNMMDEARLQGLAINLEKLGKSLGVPVLPTVAVDKTGLAKIQPALDQAGIGQVLPEVQEKIGCLPTAVSRPEQLLIMEGDTHVATQNGVPAGEHRDQIYAARRRRVNQIVAEVIQETRVGGGVAARLGRWMIRPLTGIPMLLITLILIYEIIGVFVAQTVVNFTENTVMGQYYEPLVRAVVNHFVGAGSAVGHILTGQFGLLTMTVTYLFGLLLPLVIGFNLVLAILEDTGYLPRIAALMDRVLTGLGLNGQAIIPMVLGFGCVTMALMSTRLLGSDRERRIAIFLLALTVPCSAQLAIIATMLAGLGAGYGIIYGLIIFSIFVAAGSLLGRFLPGQSSSLWIDLPVLRLPRLDNVAKKTLIKSADFIKEAAPLFAIGTVFLSILDYSGALGSIENFLVPLTVGWLGLPKEAASGFIMGFVRREFGTAGLFSFPMNSDQKLVALTTITLFVPCIASAMVIFKERGLKEGLAVWVSVICLAFFLGGLFNHLIKFFAGFSVVSPLTMVAGTVVLTLTGILTISWFTRQPYQL